MVRLTPSEIAVLSSPLHSIPSTTSVSFLDPCPSIRIQQQKMHRYNTRFRDKVSSRGAPIDGSPLPESPASPLARTGKKVHFKSATFDINASALGTKSAGSIEDVVVVASLRPKASALSKDSKAFTLEIPPLTSSPLGWLPPKLEPPEIHRRPTTSKISLGSPLPTLKLEPAGITSPFDTLTFNFHRPPSIPAASSKPWSHARLTAILGLTQHEFESVLTVLSAYFEDHPCSGREDRSALCARLNTLLFPAPLVAKIRAVDEDGYLCYQLARAGKRRTELRRKPNLVVCVLRYLCGVGADVRYRQRWSGVCRLFPKM